ncbi:MAG TPA: hypothetical protein VHF27_07940 [Acidimicrobiales bacterium]|nr:hypothetical protein [Acidimicrobiales bacterium]
MTETVCPCDVFVHPRLPLNPPGRSSISYRAGEFASFRHALLLARPGERQLTRWRPSPNRELPVHDLALQMVEWWAYVADVLTFYNERIANQAYLRTADLPESVSRLIRLLGYRPRPGIGATGVVAALLGAAGPGTGTVTLPENFQIQSKPGPGRRPQIFEVDTGTVVGRPEVVAVDPPPDPALVTVVAGDETVLLSGAASNLEAGDRVLVLPAGWTGSGALTLATVKSVTEERLPRGAPATRVAFSSPLGLGGAQAAGYRVLRSTLTARLWPYAANAAVVVTSASAHLDSVHRLLAPGDPVVLEVPGGAAEERRLLRVGATSELVWFANGNPADPATPRTSPPLDAKETLIGIPHTVVGFADPLPGADVSALGAVKSSLVAAFGWQEVGRPIPRPARSMAVGDAPLVLTAVDGAALPPMGAGVPVLVEDGSGAGVRGLAAAGTAPGSVSVRAATPATTLHPPLRALFGVVGVSRGETVPFEVLGSGDATKAVQVYTLKQSPLTYLPDPDPSSSSPYRSTLEVFVDGVRWTEVPSFYDRGPGDRVFVTREIEDGHTQVVSGDGVHGARFPSGSNNVTAAYRHGSGAVSPGPGGLSVIVRPRPGLKAIRNPVAVGGGSDPDPPDQIRRYAPKSVLTFGRAVSADDYETIAVQAPGVARARSYWGWDGGQQRAVVTVFVGDDDAAVSSAEVALAAADDPNRPVVVRLATPVTAGLFLAFRSDGSRPRAALTAEVRAALSAPSGLFGGEATRIGHGVYESEVDGACLAVPGVVAVHRLVFFVDRGTGFQLEPGPRFDPGVGAFFTLSPQLLFVFQEGG